MEEMVDDSMERMIVLGTGYAGATRCYNTCFAIETTAKATETTAKASKTTVKATETAAKAANAASETTAKTAIESPQREYFLVDTGGGNGILTQLEKAKIPLTSIHHIFISHEHPDHLLGIVWLIRMIGTAIRKGDYEGKLRIYCHEGLITPIRKMAEFTLVKKVVDLIDDRILLIPVADGEQLEILSYDVTFFDIHSDKAKQFGFVTTLQNGKKFCFLGDEPYRECERAFAENADWLLHEAFCLYRDREKFKPYEKFHTTVKEACENATLLGAKSVILYHTEDRTLEERKETYTKEGRNYFAGPIYVPDDLDVIEL